MNKQCFKCREDKPISEFYRHPAMKDGHLGKCKTCAKRDVAERAGRLGNNPEWLAKERERCRIKQERYRKLGLAAPCTTKARVKWQKKNPHKRKAQGIAMYALKRGEIKKQSFCSSCGKTGRLHKHHPDYSLPKMIVWLCPKCHGVAHRKPFGTPIAA